MQAFTLTVQQAPAITSAASTTFTVGTPGTFTVTTTGFPTPTVSQTGTLPTGVTFTPATRVLGGTATQTGAFPLVFTATNGVSPDATQNFTLNVVCPAITVTPLVMPDGLYQTVYAGVDFNQTGSTGTTFTWGATGLPGGLDHRCQHRRRLRHAHQYGGGRRRRRHGDGQLRMPGHAEHDDDRPPDHRQRELHSAASATRSTSLALPSR